MNDLSCSLHPSNELVVFERSRPLFTFFFLLFNFCVACCSCFGVMGFFRSFKMRGGLFWIPGVMSCQPTDAEESLLLM
jgi:hypothetical protein